MLAAKDTEPFAVGDWLVQPDVNRISTTTETINLRPQVMEILVHLADLKGRVASLESIHDDLWSGKFVSSGTIYNCISELRQALSKDGRNQDYIETIPKRGYRLAPPAISMPRIATRECGVASVAVLPLSNHSMDEGNDYLCEGIADEVLQCLSKVNGLRVFSARTLKDSRLDARVVGLRFGAHMVLTGGLQRSGDSLRVCFRLENVSDGETVWSEHFDHDIAEIFRLQDAVAKRLVRALSPFIDDDADTQVADYSGTQSLKAFNSFLLGKHALSKSTLQSYEDAIRYFEQAVAVDPTFARAHYRLYLACYMRCRAFGEDRQSMERSRLAAAAAEEQGYRPAVPWIHIHRRLYRDTRPSGRELALEALDKIRTSDPEWGSFAYEQLTWILTAAGYFKAGLEFAKRMLDSAGLNFEDSDADEELPYFYSAVGQQEEAIRLWSSEIQKDPVRPLFRHNRSLLYARTGQFQYAERDMDVLEEEGMLALTRAFYHFWRGHAGRVKECHQRLCSLQPTHPSDLLWTYSMIGDIDSAIQQYEKSVNSKCQSYIDFGPLRVTSRAKLPMTLVRQLEAHPGFQRLLAADGVDDDWRMELMQRVNELTHITGIKIDSDEVARQGL